MAGATHMHSIFHTRRSHAQNLRRALNHAQTSAALSDMSSHVPGERFVHKLVTSVIICARLHSIIPYTVLGCPCVRQCLTRHCISSEQAGARSSSPGSDCTAQRWRVLAGLKTSTSDSLHRLHRLHMRSKTARRAKRCRSGAPHPPGHKNRVSKPSHAHAAVGELPLLHGREQAASLLVHQLVARARVGVGAGGFVRKMGAV